MDYSNNSSPPQRRKRPFKSSYFGFYLLTGTLVLALVVGILKFAAVSNDLDPVLYAQPFSGNVTTTPVPGPLR
jgi:hypothetical protein